MHPQIGLPSDFGLRRLWSDFLSLKMAVKIRLQRHGRKSNPYYKIVVADSRSPRDGKFIERLGFYNPMTTPATIEIDRQKALDWIAKGAQPTDTVRAILRYKGVMYRKHLLRGVAKGALTQEQADLKWQEFIDSKETKVQERIDLKKKEKTDYYKKLSGVAAPKPVAVVEEAPAPAADETSAEEVVEPEVQDVPVVEEAAVSEVATAPEEAPVADETPAEAAPEAEATPAEENPTAEATPTEEAPAQEVLAPEVKPAEETPVAEVSTEETTPEAEPAQEADEEEKPEA